MEVVGYHKNQVYVNELTDWASAYGQRNNVMVNVVGDLQLAEELGAGKTVVTVAADTGLKYLASDLYPA